MALSVYVSFGMPHTENVLLIYAFKKVCPGTVMKKQIFRCRKECFKSVSLLYSVTLCFIADEEYEDGD